MEKFQLKNVNIGIECFFLSGHILNLSLLWWKVLFSCFSSKLDDIKQLVQLYEDIVVKHVTVRVVRALLDEWIIQSKGRWMDRLIDALIDWSIGLRLIAYLSDLSIRNNK